VHALRAVVVTAIVTLLAIEADIHEWLDTSTITDLPRLDVAAKLDNYASAFMARRADTEEAWVTYQLNCYAYVREIDAAQTHGDRGQIIHEPMNIRHADARGVELDQDLVWSRLRYRDHFDLQFVVRSFIVYHTRLALFRDLEFRGHVCRSPALDRGQSI
jgi:hypothetical protein